MPQFGQGMPKRALTQQADPKACPMNQVPISFAAKQKWSDRIPTMSTNAAATGAMQCKRPVPVRALTDIRIMNHEGADCLVVQGLAIDVPKRPQQIQETA